MEPKNISQKMLKRLPVYVKYLLSLPEDTTHISATAIAKALDLGDVQVRKDLAKISDGGRRRVGYVKEDLLRDIELFLSRASTTGTIVVGAGKLGCALLDHKAFGEMDLDIMAAFDRDPVKSRSDSGKPIYPIDRMRTYCQRFHVSVAILAVPAGEAQTVCDELVSCGIRAIWNFAPIRLKVPDHVIVQNENLAATLAALCMQIHTHSTDSEPADE